MGEVIEPKRWYTTARVADLLGVHAETVRSWLKSGKLAGKTTGRGRSWQFLGSSILAIQRASARVLDPAAPLAVPAPADLPSRRRPKVKKGVKGRHPYPRD
jgi:excisionase family DNA binding protein